MTQRSLQAARLSLAQGDVAAARAHCAQILRSAPHEPGAAHLLGVMAHQEGDFAAAETWLRQAAQASDTSPLYLLTYADLCRRATAPDEALALTRRALRLDPASALAWFLLGSQLLDRREYAESRASLERARELAPDLWRARAQLAILAARTGEIEAACSEFDALLAEWPADAQVVAHHAGFLAGLGRHAQALAQTERAIELAPAELEHHLRAADIELELGRSLDALRRIEALASRWPDDPKLIACRVMLLRLTDSLPAALALCRDAAERGIESPDLLRAYGQALHLTGQDTLALAALDRAAAVRPAAALTEKAVILTQLGRFPEALEALERALAHDPTFVDAWYERANVKTHRASDPEITAMQRLLDGGCSYREQLLLSFALGKAYFESGDAQRALDHWHEGNRLKRALLDFDIAAACRELDSFAGTPLLRASTPLLDATASTAVRGSQLPVFVVGMPRCGSSLLEQILASHPDVRGAGEQLRLRDLFAPLAASSASSNEQTLEEIARAALATLRGISASAARIIDKDLVNFKYLGAIHRVFPRARIIHCRRDPMDTCFSAYTKLFLGDFPFTYDLRELGLYYKSYSSLMEHWRTVLPQSCFLEIDYENLVAQPRQTTQRLLDFLDLAWDETCLRFFETPRAVNTASLAQVRQPIYRSSVGRAGTLLPRLRPLVAALGAST